MTRKNNRRIIKWLLVTLFVIVLITFSGCWSSSELGDRAIVIGTGIDIDEENKIKVTTQVIHPLKVKTDKEMATIVLSSKGETVFDAVRNMIPITERKILWDHLDIIIIGSSAAKKDITPILDFFTRDYELRLKPWVFFSHVSTEKILTTRSHFENIPAVGISKVIETQKRALSFAPQVNYYQFVKMMLSPEKIGYAPIINRIKKGESYFSYVKGMAVIKGGKWIGNLNQKEARGLLWVKGEVGGGIIVTPIPGVTEKEEDNNKISLEILGSKSSIKPILNDKGELLINLNIKSTVNIGEILGSLPITIHTIEQIKHEASLVIEKEIKSSLEKTQKKFKADIYGINDTVHRKYPDYWKKNKENWAEIFSNLSIKLNVSINIQNQGFLKHSAEE